MNLLKTINSRQFLEKINKKTFVKRYVNFFLGALLIAISYNVFIASNKLVPGGIGGIAIIFNYLFKIPNSLTILIFGIILLILSFFLLGKEKTKASILGSLLFPLLVQLTKNINIWLDFNTDDILLATVFGGVIYGFGAGLVFKAGFTTGGTDIINQIISKYFKISIGSSMLISDGLIAFSSAFFFGPINCMYSIIILYIISLMSDKVILGISDSKAFYIIKNLF